MTWMQALLLLLARVFLGVLFVYYGVLEVVQWGMGVEAMISIGLPAPSVFVIVTILFAFLGGISVFLGYRMRIGLILLMICLIPTTWIMYGFGRSGIQILPILNHLAIFGGCCGLYVAGPGVNSFDKG